MENNQLYVRDIQTHYYNRSILEFGMFLKNSNTLVGRIGIHEVSWNPVIRELGYWLCTGYEGQGYMSETVQALLTVCFENLQAHKVIIRARKRKSSARRMWPEGRVSPTKVLHVTIQPSNTDNARMVEHVLL